MKIDTSSYYPESPLGDDPEEERAPQAPASERQSLFPDHSDGKEEKETPASALAKLAGLEKREIREEPQYETEPPEIKTDTDRVLNAIATFFSWSLVPLLMPVYGILLAFHLSVLHFKPDDVKLSFTLIVAAFNVVIPMLLVLLLKKLGFVEDVGLNGRRERVIPYLITIVCMGATALLMHSKLAPQWLVMFFTGGAVAGIVNLLINFRWKISAHAAGIAGIVALIVRIMHSDMALSSITVWLMVSIGLAGLLGSSRVWQGRHTVWQVLAGYAVGFCAVFFMTMIR